MAVVCGLALLFIFPIREILLLAKKKKKKEGKMKRLEDMSWVIIKKLMTIANPDYLVKSS